MFIRTITQNPSLALYVKRLELANPAPDIASNAPFECDPKLLEEDWSPLLLQLKAYSTARDELATGGTVDWAEPYINFAASDFFDSLSYQSTDCLAACLLLLLPNLEIIHARCYGGNGFTCLEVMRMARMLQIHQNATVTESKTSAYSLSKVKESSGVVGTFQLQSIRKFACEIRYRVPVDMKGCLYEIQIRDLTLHTVALRNFQMGQILKMCHHLEHVRLSFTFPQNAQAALIGLRFDPTIFFQSIAHLTNTLQSLAIIDLNAAEGTLLINHDIIALRSIPVYQLSGFHKLHSLEISRQIFPGIRTQ